MPKSQVPSLKGELQITGLFPHKSTPPLRSGGIGNGFTAGMRGWFGMGIKKDQRKPHRARVIAAYKRTGSLRKAGEACGISGARVHQIIKKHAPKLMNDRGHKTEEVVRARRITQAIKMLERAQALLSEERY